MVGTKSYQKRYLGPWTARTDSEIIPDIRTSYIIRCPFRFFPFSTCYPGNPCFVTFCLAPKSSSHLAIPLPRLPVLQYRSRQNTLLLTMTIFHPVSSSPIPRPTIQSMSSSYICGPLVQKLQLQQTFFSEVTDGVPSACRQAPTQILT